MKAQAPYDRDGGFCAGLPWVRHDRPGFSLYCELDISAEFLVHRDWYTGEHVRLVSNSTLQEGRKR